MTCTVESWFSSLSQPFPAVIQSGAGEAQEDLKDDETHAQGLLSDTTVTLCPSFRKMLLLMQGRAEDCLQPPGEDNLALQPGGLAINPRGKTGS